MSLFRVRPYAQTDEGFIYSTWLKGLYYGNDWFHEIPKDTFFKNYHKVIELIIKRPDCEISCAVLKQDEDVILSFIVVEKTTLHWIYTKEAWRKFGLARMLIPEGIETVTSLTKVGKAIKPYKWKFNPFLI